MEEWINVRGYRAYAVSSLGRVRHNRIGRILPQRVDRNGDTRVLLTTDRGQEWLYVVELMGWHFISRYNERMRLLHVDGDKTNNELSNLRPYYDGEWKTIPASSEYEMSSEGAVRRIGSRRCLRPSRNGTVNLSSQGVVQTCSINKLHRELFGR